MLVTLFDILSLQYKADFLQPTLPHATSKVIEWNKKAIRWVTCDMGLSSFDKLWYKLLNYGGGGVSWSSSEAAVRDLYLE